MRRSIRSSVKGNIRVSVRGSISPANTVSDQAFTYGALSNDQDGAYTVVPDNGTITSISIDSGDAGGDYETSGATIRTAVGSTVPSVILSCTATFSDASTDTFTATITSVANQYTVANETELDTVMAIAVGTLSGKSVALRSGDYNWTTRFSSKAFTSEFTVTSSDNDNRARFIGSNSTPNNLGSPTYLKFYQVDMFTDWTDGVSANDRAALVVTGNWDNFTIDDCEWYSNAEDHFALMTATNSFGWKGAIGIDGSSDIVGPVTITNNTFHGLRRGLDTPAASGGSLTIEGNTIYDITNDFITLGGPIDNFSISWNTLYALLRDATWTDHADFIQSLGSTTTDISNGTIVGNILVVSDPEGKGSDDAIQGIFLEDINNDDTDNRHYVNMVIGGNTVYARGNHGISLYNAEDSWVVGNTCVSPQDAVFADRLFIGLLQHFSSGTTNNVRLSDNISKETFLSGDFGAKATNITVTNNLDIAPSDYVTYFDGPDFDPNSVAETLTMFSIKAGTTPDTASPKMGSVGTGYVDYVNKTFTHPTLAPSFTGSTSNQTFTQGVAITPIDYSTEFSGVVTSYALSQTAPAGLSFDTTTGILSGTPTNPDGDLTGVFVTASGPYGADADSTTFNITIDPAVTINRISWPGTTYLSDATPANMANTGKFIFYLSAYFDTVADTTFLFDFRGTGEEAHVTKINQNVRLTMINGSGTIINSNEAASLSTSGRQNLILAVDTTTGVQNVKAYLNDTEIIGWSTPAADQTIDFTSGTINVFGTSSSGANRYADDSEVMYVAINQWVDLSVAANRRLFHDAGAGDPTDLTGAPQGSIIIRGDAADTTAGVNDGNSGTMTKVGSGTITDVP